MSQPLIDWINEAARSMEITEDIIEVMRVSLKGIVKEKESARQTVLALDALKYVSDRIPEMKASMEKLEQLSTKC